MLRELHSWDFFCFYVGATYMPKFIDNTDSTFDAPSGSTSDIAQTRKLFFVSFFN